MGQADTAGTWALEIEGMPHCDMAMRRVGAWLGQAIIDRPPIRFARHSVQHGAGQAQDASRWPTLRDRWFDAEYQVEAFVRRIRGKRFPAETFPVFWPNLGPEVYAAFYGCELEYRDVTSYAKPVVRDWGDMASLRLDMGNPYLRKIDEMTRIALDRCGGMFLVGYTDLHPGVDCAAAWRDPQQLCVDMVMEPGPVKALIDLANRDFARIFDHFHGALRARGQPSVGWMGVPAFGKLHLPAADFASLVSPEMFDEFILPSFAREMAHADHNIFHVDGRGVAKNIDRILELPNLNAIQWAQGVGDDRPILQWVPLIRKIRAAGKSVIVDVAPHELEGLMGALRPEGLFLWIGAEPGTEEDIIRRVERW